MSPPPALPAHRRSLDFARARDARICWLLDMHPVTAAMLVRVGWFPTKNKALKRLNRLVVRKRIRLVGTVCQKPGRPENVFCRWTPKVDYLLHESSVGYAIFQVVHQVDTVGNRLKEVQDSVQVNAVLIILLNDANVS